MVWLLRVECCHSFGHASSKLVTLALSKPAQPGQSLYDLRGVRVLIRHLLLEERQATGLHQFAQRVNVFWSPVETLRTGREELAKITKFSKQLFIVKENPSACCT